MLASNCSRFKERKGRGGRGGGAALRDSSLGTHRRRTPPTARPLPSALALPRLRGRYRQVWVRGGPVERGGYRLHSPWRLPGEAAARLHAFRQPPAIHARRGRSGASRPDPRVRCSLSTLETSAHAGSIRAMRASAISPSTRRRITTMSCSRRLGGRSTSSTWSGGGP